MKFSFFVVIFLFSLQCFTVNAQSHAMIDAETQAYINQYITYTNMNIHALRLYQRKFEQFNTTLNQYYGEAPFERDTRVAYEAKKGKSLKFEVPNVLNDPAVFDVLPENLYKQIQSATPSHIQPERLIVIKSRLKDVHDIATEIYNISNMMQEYCLNGSYLDDVGMEVPYQMLSRVAILFHDFSEAKDLLNYELKGVENTFFPPNQNNSYVRSANKLLTFILYARNTLIALKKDDKDMVKEQIPLMETALADLQENGALYLYGINNPAAVDQFEATKRKAEVFLKLIHEYVEKPYIADPKYISFGNEYYYYNQYFLNNYNRYGAGIVFEYNKFIDLSDSPILKMVEEPHWLKLTPQPDRPDKPKKPEPVVVEEPKNVIKMEAPEVSNPQPVVPVVDTPKVEVPVFVEPTPAPVPSEMEGIAPINFVFLLDVSGSMEAPYKLPILKRSFKYLLNVLRPEDKVSIVVYSGNARIALPATSCKEKNKIISVLDNLESSGKSDIFKGIKLAYKAAEQGFLPDGNNRIILATDGGIDISPELTALIHSKAIENIRLSLFYFDDKEYGGKAGRLKVLPENGLGTYSFIRESNAEETLLKEAKSVRKK